MRETFLDPSEWYASLPTFFASAGMLFTDVNDKVLLVKPNYRPDWSIPGGVVEADEDPDEAATREIEEELGLKVRVGGLLVVDWAPPVHDRPRAMVNFLFDGGVIMDKEEIRIQVEELDDVGFFPWSEAAERLPLHAACRIPAALRARENGRTVYLPRERRETDAT
ncbi:NUDIX domain-containing protein [Sinosporangium siamense]|uniref:NUDIX domain-containing protein n=1 Tax=Sinosporangium siamense TaxID=1367973 RepID=UPI001951F258|nr:NUDIX hydrolase [Sinosporangium siamense]